MFSLSLFHLSSMANMGKHPPPSQGEFSSSWADGFSPQSWSSTHGWLCGFQIHLPGKPHPKSQSSSPSKQRRVSEQQLLLDHTFLVLQGRGAGGVARLVVSSPELADPLCGLPHTHWEKPNRLTLSLLTRSLAWCKRSPNRPLRLNPS